MARRRNNLLRNFLAGAASGALSTASSGNPYVIGGGAVVGGTLSALQEDPYYEDEYARRAAFNKVRSNTLRRARDQANEVGSAYGTRFANRGISGGVREGVIQGNRRMIQQSANDKLAEMEFALEMDIANRREMKDEQARQRWNRQLAAIATQGSQLANQVFNPDQFTVDSPGVLKIREALGIETPEKFDINQYFEVNGQKIAKNSSLGVLYQSSSDFVKQLSESYFGGLKGLGEILR